MYDIIRQQLARTAPFATLLAVVVESVGAGHAVAALPAHPRLANHVGSVHAGAVFTICEAAAGAALAGGLLPLIMQTRFVVRDARIDYLEPARGAVTARATLIAESGDPLDDLRRAGRADLRVDVAAFRADGTRVAEARFDWSLRLLA
jgi:uncharacterized protein (TIGR00369 family)